MPGLTRSQLRKAKKAVRTYNENQNNEDAPQTIRDIKKVIKASLDNDDNNLDSARKKIKKLKKESKNNISVKWNIKSGDFVSFENDGIKEVGIIISMNLGDSYRSKYHAKHAGSVLVMSSIGNMWLKPFKVFKIEE